MNRRVFIRNILGTAFAVCAIPAVAQTSVVDKAYKDLLLEKLNEERDYKIRDGDKADVDFYDSLIAYVRANETNPSPPAADSRQIAGRSDRLDMSQMRRDLNDALSHVSVQENHDSLAEMYVYYVCALENIARRRSTNTLDSNHLSHYLFCRGKFEELASAIKPAVEPEPVKLVDAADIRRIDTVHFKFDQTNMYKGDEQIIDDVVAAHSQNPNSLIMVFTGTDTKGSVAYNAKLALERAERLYSELDNRGVHMDRVAILPTGETLPIVDTGDEVRNKENRYGHFIVAEFPKNFDPSILNDRDRMFYDRFRQSFPELGQKDAPVQPPKQKLVNKMTSGGMATPGQGIW